MSHLLLIPGLVVWSPAPPFHPCHLFLWRRPHWVAPVSPGQCPTWQLCSYQCVCSAFVSLFCKSAKLGNIVQCIIEYIVVFIVLENSRKAGLCHFKQSFPLFKKPCFIIWSFIKKNRIHQWVHENRFEWYTYKVSPLKPFIPQQRTCTYKTTSKSLENQLISMARNCHKK